MSQKDKVDRTNPGCFKGVAMREDCDNGCFAGFDYSGDAFSECQTFFKCTGKVINPLIVRETLEEEIARKLA